LRTHFFEGNKIRIGLHLLAWSILLGLPLYFVKRWEVGKDFIWIYYTVLIINGIIFYFNYLVLVPKYFFNTSKRRYYLSVLIFLVIIYIISEASNEMIFKYVPGTDQLIERKVADTADQRRGPPKPGGPIAGPPFMQLHLFNYIFTASFLIFFSLGLRVIERHSQIEKLQKDLESEKLNSELAFLKNQVSPHFFFNTLNNIYSLIGINAENSQKAVLKLSKLMRYLLYESEHGDSRLSNEIEFMNNYIDLMKLRMNDKVSVTISFPEDYDDRTIPPLLFVPFVENAFKHGISYREKSFIDINLVVRKDLLLFRCTNSIFKNREEPDKGHSGIGLENVTKRLSLLFPGKHELKINRSDTEYEVLLQIILA
jgi:two-component system, LytTR family, sensor kinase